MPIGDREDRLTYKQDWPEAKLRIRAYWDPAAVDRPNIDVKAPVPTHLEPLPTPVSLEDIWLDADYLAAEWERAFESTYLGGEAVPAGPILLAGYATGCGPGVQFAENTIWHPVTMRSIEEPLGWWPGPDDPWRPKLATVIERLLSRAPGRFLVGYTNQIPAHDLLMLLRGANGFLLELAEKPALCLQRMQEAYVLHIENFEYFRGLIDASQTGCVWGWPGIWHPTFVKATQSDMSCMISGAMFDEYVVPEPNLLGDRYGLIWYHLDGRGPSGIYLAFCLCPT